MGRMVGDSISHEQMRIPTNLAEAAGVLSRTDSVSWYGAGAYSVPLSLGSSRSLTASPNMFRL